MPGSLVEFARRPGDDDGDDAGDEVRWAGEDEGNVASETQCFYDCWELEAGQFQGSLCDIAE